MARHICANDIDYGLGYNHVAALKIDKMIQKCKRFDIVKTLEIGRVSPVFAATDVNAQCCLAKASACLQLSYFK